MKEYYLKLIRLLFGILFFLTVVGTSPALSMMQSANFKVDSDVIGSEGGPGGSANYKATDTMGEPAIGESGSANYKTKAGFWYMGGQAAAPGLGLTCSATSVYMNDYTLGNANNYNSYYFSGTQDCIVADNTAVAWDLTLQSTNMTGTKNTIPNTNIKLSTDGVTSTQPTTTTGAGGNITELSASDYALNVSRSVVHGTTSATGNYSSRTTIRIENLNNLYQETNDTATFTFTVS